MNEYPVGEILWAILFGGIASLFFSRVGWGYKYAGKYVDRWTARWRK